MPRRKNQPLRPDTPVEELWNLSKVSAGWLRDLGITTHAELARADLVAVWSALRATHPQVTRLMYLAMWGAVHDTHWREVPDAAREELEARAAAERSAVRRCER